MNQRKKILFITGTRADYGKIKPIMQKMEKKQKEYEVFVYVSGMHLLQKYGSTYREVQKDGYKNTYVAFEQVMTDNMSYNLGVVLMNLARYAEQIKPDMIVVHGDRIDALAGAITGALNNILVAHIEGGEISGTIDDSIRHAISKFAHLHFVCNEEAKKRLLQMGEQNERIFVIGSPDIDIMLSDTLPSLQQAYEKYEVDFDTYSIFMYHPVTTEIEKLPEHIGEVVDALLASEKNYIVVYPNNDNGTEVILNEIGRLYGNKRFRVFPSIRFEYFLTFLKNAETVILATGVSTAKAYPGEEQFLGRGVSYCATCDAPLYRGKTAAIIGFSPKEEAEADFMAEMADKVYYIPMYEADVNVADSVEVLREKPVSVEGSLKVQELVTDRNRYDVDGVFFLRESVSPAQLVPGLKIEDNHIAVDRQMRTNLAGCFACGDAVGAPYQYIKSAGEGNVAALSAVAYLAEKKRQSK